MQGECLGWLKNSLFLVKDFFPDDEKRGSGEGTGVSAGDSTNEKSEREELGRFSANEEQSNQHKNNGERVVERSDHGFGDCLIHRT